MDGDQLCISFRWDQQLTGPKNGARKGAEGGSGEERWEEEGRGEEETRETEESSEEEKNSYETEVENHREGQRRRSEREERTGGGTCKSEGGEKGAEAPCMVNVEREKFRCDNNSWWRNEGGAGLLLSAISKQ